MELSMLNFEVIDAGDIEYHPRISDGCAGIF